MTRPKKRSSGRTRDVDIGLVNNLDALNRDVSDIEAVAAAALDGGPFDDAVVHRLATTSTGLGYEALTVENQKRREVEGWGEAELTDVLDPVALAQIDAWRGAQRLRWDRGDLVAVGAAGFLGALAILYDSQMDSGVLKGLAWLKKSDLLRQWERDAVRLPIDYTGPNFGGPAHRLRSPGHDVGRFFSALDQIRTGTFTGTYWEDGRRIVEEVKTSRSGMPFAQAPEPHLAVALLLKHWAADFVTPMSLPLPGWSLLYEMPDRDLRKFAHTAYAGTSSGDGLNLRSGGLTPGLGMVATELIVRTHSHLAAYRQTGSPHLRTNALSKRTEMLLAAHAAAGAVSLSKTTAAAMSGETVAAVRHLNVPVLMRVGMLALEVRSNFAEQAAAGPPSWGQILENEASTWTLPEAVAMVDLLDRETADPRAR